MSGHDVCPRGWGWIPQSIFLLRITWHPRQAWQISSSLCERGRYNHDKKTNIFTRTRHLLTTASIAPQYHENTQLLPPSKPSSLGSTHFGTFKCPNSQNVYCQPLPPSRPRSLGSTHVGTFKGPNLQNVHSQPHQSPDRLGVSILELSRFQISKICIHLAFRALVCRPCSRMLPATLLQSSCINSNTCPKLVGITPNAIVIVRRNLS